MNALDLLKRVSIFRQLTGEALSKTAARLQSRQVSSGELLFNLGDPGDELFIVREGRVAIFVPSVDKPGEERPIRIFESGEALGEMALIDRRPRSASARALEAGAVLVLTGDDFRRLLGEYPDVALGVMSGLNDRIRYTTEFLGEVQEWVRRIAEGKYDRAFKPSVGHQDRSISGLAAEFAQMAAQVKKREAELRQELVKLRIRIDHEKREREVAEVIETDYFKSLRSEAKRLRENDTESTTK